MLLSAFFVVVAPAMSYAIHRRTRPVSVRPRGRRSREVRRIRRRQHEELTEDLSRCLLEESAGARA
ncbi:hypothetical protein [Nocardiopsis xinjiangensis]|uniref:hypothetical protein n=1 Tax=Nocardiopsis xinjiangensis TaxID=124285 RepID=UPI00034527FB|nr:hypothetical protein [Nocardiopsis xinjiangensis]